MKGFKPTAKHLAKTTGHQFPSNFGFSGSTGKVKQIGPYSRGVPKAKGSPMVKKSKGGMACYKEGGEVDHADIQRSEPSNQLDAESGGKTPLRPGFKKGGRTKKAFGGRMGGGALAGATRAPNIPRVASTGLRMPGSSAFGKMPLGKRPF